MFDYCIDREKTELSPPLRKSIADAGLITPPVRIDFTAKGYAALLDTTPQGACCRVWLRWHGRQCLMYNFREMGMLAIETCCRSLSISATSL